MIINVDFFETHNGNYICSKPRKVYNFLYVIKNVSHPFWVTNLLFKTYN